MTPTDTPTIIPVCKSTPGGRMARGTAEAGSTTKKKQSVFAKDTFSTQSEDATFGSLQLNVRVPMARRVFFSFHYQRDVWRVNQIRNIGEVIGSAAAGFQDASLWEEAKKKGDDAIKRMIDGALANTSVTVVFIGAQTAGRKFINYEIEQSIARGNGLVGIQIHHLKDRQQNVDQPGVTPAKLVAGNYKLYKYSNSDALRTAIEEAAKAAGR